MSDHHLDIQKAHWDALASAVDDDIAMNHWIDEAGEPVDVEMFTQIARYLKAEFLDGEKEGRVLEVGCGNGLILKELQAILSDNWMLDGADVSNEMLKRIQNDNISVMCCDARDVPHADSQYDLIYLHSVVQYFEGEAYLRSVIDECCRLLKRGGHLCIMDVPFVWYREFMTRNDMVARIKKLVKRRMKYKFVRDIYGLLKGRSGTRMAKEVIGGQSILLPAIKGYYADPDIFYNYDERFRRISIEVQPFSRKPLIYRRFRFNIMMRNLVE